MSPSVLATNEMIETPDQVLAALGATNPLILSLFAALSAVWGLSAMPMMASAFMMGDVCRMENRTDCTFTPGTIAEEFELSGSKSSLADFTTSSFLFGNVVGASLSRLSDRYGRRPILVNGLALVGIVGCLSSMAPEIYSLIIMRFLQGVFYTGCGLANWVLAYESIPAKLRSYSALLFGLMWVVGYVAVAPLAYTFTSWRVLIVVVSAPCIAFSAIYYFVLPESFHFLVLKRRRAEIEAWITRANRWSLANRLPVKVDLDILLANTKRIDERHRSDSSSGILRVLFSNQVLLLYTLAFAYLWSCDTFVYFGLSLFSTQLNGNRYFNYAFSGLVEVPAYMVSPFLLDRLGRKTFVCVAHSITAACFLLVSFFGGDGPLTLFLWLLGKCAISCAFLSLFVFASEVFPTAYRNSCIGACEVVARLGGVFAPAVRSMSLISPALPTLLCGIASGLAALTSLTLPETLHKELPDSADDLL